LVAFKWLANININYNRKEYEIMGRYEVVKEVQNDFIDFVKNEAIKKELSEEVVVGLTRLVSLDFKPNGSIKL
jgi:hypothetical protein